MGLFLKILNFVAISLLFQFGISFFLIVFGKTKNTSSEKNTFDFTELFFDYANLPKLETFVARDDEKLAFRHYPSNSDKVLLLIHGSGYHSRYLLPLADYISQNGLAEVYTPDLRGHGSLTQKRGDIAYINQLEDDLLDLIKHIQKNNDKKLIIGGHSSGGGLVVRFAGSKNGQIADAYLLLSPFLKYNAPTIRPNSGGWANPYNGRIAGLSILNNLGIHWFDFLDAIEFNMPEEARDGTETLRYSHRLNTGYAPRNYKKDLKAISQPLLVIVGANDEAFIPEKFEPIIGQYTPAQVELLANLSHMGVVVNTKVQPVIKEWLDKLFD